MSETENADLRRQLEEAQKETKREREFKRFYDENLKQHQKELEEMIAAYKLLEQRTDTAEAAARELWGGAGER